MSDYEKMQERDRELAQEMDVLFQEIAALMAKDGWAKRLKGDDEMVSGTWREYVLVKGTMAVHFRRDHGGKRDKVNVSSWAWPEYSHMDRGEVRKTTVTPRDLYDPKEESPAISCSIVRGAGAIVKDVNRRFLPEYGRIYARCEMRAKSAQQYSDKSQAGWKAICAVIEKASNRDSHSVKTVLGDYSLEVSNRSGKAHVVFDCDAEVLNRVLAAINQEVA